MFGIISVLLIGRQGNDRWGNPKKPHADSSAKGVFVSQVDLCLVLATYGNISSEFDALQDGDWLLSSYMLAQCIAQPLVTALEAKVIGVD